MSKLSFVFDFFHLIQNKYSQILQGILGRDPDCRFFFEIPNVSKEIYKLLRIPIFQTVFLIELASPEGRQYIFRF